MQTLRGAWMRANIEVNPMYSQWTTVSERHSDEDEPNDVRRVETYSAESYQPTGTPAELEPDASRAGLIDKTPVRDHRPGVMWPNMDLAELGVLHGERLGAAERATTTFAPYPMFGTRWHIELQRDMDAPPAAQGAGDRPDLIRGLNAFAANNPPQEMYQGDGWRHTFWQKHWRDHNLSLPQRFHRFRIVPKWVAKVASDTPGEGGPYDASWSSLARVIKRQFAMPRMRRQPGPIDENIISDGTEMVDNVSVGNFI